MLKFLYKLLMFLGVMGYFTVMSCILGAITAYYIIDIPCYKFLIWAAYAIVALFVIVWLMAFVYYKMTIPKELEKEKDKI